MNRKVILSVVNIPVFVLTTIILLAVTGLTLMPLPESDGEMFIPHFDKIVHFLMFGALGVALSFDCGRYARRLSCIVISVSIIFSGVFGALIELMQENMAMGRSADIADWWADIAGAIVCTIAFYPLVRMMVRKYVFSFEPICNMKSMPADLRWLYEDAFPIEERRPWNDICDRISIRKGNYNIWAIIYCGKFAGFISWWNLPLAVYIEHFAVCPGMRGRGIGALAIKEFFRLQGRTMILEVEPSASSQLAERRIGFYNRCGFVSHPEFDYVQPPYSAELSSVKLMLMTIGADISLADAAESIRTEVYGVKNPD
ncbi:MAG: GNAT family N-acetyltransferase [Paramuribaculum sp.]|nr:GNAT family N-acetyltransferase [Paramuribaculum sp.]